MTDSRPLREARKIGPYRLEKQLGAGGMGVVYQAFDERFSRPVALKQILPDRDPNEGARKRFRREARSAARLSHPGIVSVHNLFEAEGCDWIVMELVEGETLARLLQQGPLSTEHTLTLGTEIADALAAAHAEGIVHRDLKAKNVLVTTSDQTALSRSAPGRPKILDFGLAKQVLHDDGKSTSITAEGHLVGTPQAMSPEQAMGRKVGLRSDLFSLGSLLYEMVTGVSPFRADNPLETMSRICSYRPPSVRERIGSTPSALSDLVDRLLEKDPAHRPRNAKEVALALRQIADNPLVEKPGRGAPPTISSEKTIDGETVAPVAASPTRSLGERRQITVMCCEMVAADESPEELYVKSADFESLVHDVAERFEGHVATVLGHRLVVYFGYPRAREDAALRAANAAQELIRRVAPRREMAVRTGIHTGPAVVMGDGSSQEQLVLGETLDLTLRLQRIAEPDSILVSDASRPLLADAFLTHELTLDETSTEPWVGHRIVKARDTSSHWQAMGKPSTPLVAREQELEVLLGYWRRAQVGEGQVVLLSGEAGIGKSRLVRALHDQLLDDNPLWLFAQGSPYARNSPLRPAIEMLRRLLKLSSEDPPKEQFDRLESALDRRGLPLAETVPLFASLFDLPLDKGYRPLSASPELRRRQALTAIVDLVLATARKHPTVLIVEDIHWIDPSTTDLLGLLVQRLTEMPLLAAMTYRPDYQVPWDETAHLNQLNLTRLPGQGVEDLISHVTRGKSLPDEVRTRIVQKTDGVPLFVEELTRNLLESEQLVERENHWELAEPLRPLMIPASLRDSLTERLDRLGTAKAVAQLAAVVGREFSHQLLVFISPLAEKELARDLRHLTEANLVQRRGFSHRRRYQFKHALIQEAAYDSLLKEQKKRFHRKIGETLEAHFPAVSRSEPEILAHHYTTAEQFEQGITYWHRAGQYSLERSAIVESSQYARRGIELLGKIPPGAQRDRLEVELQYTFGTALTTTKGIANSESEKAYKKALELRKLSGETTDPFWLLAGLYRSQVTQAKLYHATETAGQLKALAEDRDDLSLFLFAYRALGTVHLFRGNLSSAAEYYSLLLRQDDPGRRNAYHAIQSSEDPAVVGGAFNAVNLWFQGYPEQALRMSQQAVELARRIGQNFSVTYATHISSLTHLLLHDVERTMASAQATMDQSHKQGSFWHIAAQFYLTWAKITTERPPWNGRGSRDNPEEVVKLRQDIVDYRATGGRVTQTCMLAIHAELAIQHGSLEAARKSLVEAKQIMEATDERFYEAEILRLSGELKLRSKEVEASGEQREAERDFQRAIVIAGQQNSRSLELRAAISLARLWQKQGKRRPARQPLATIYDRFTEGFETHDLVMARRLLDEPLL